MDKPRHPLVFRSWKVERLKQNKRQAMKAPSRSGRQSRKAKP